MIVNGGRDGNAMSRASQAQALSGGEEYSSANGYGAIARLWIAVADRGGGAVDQRGVHAP